jgi:hypothetical protein
MLSSYLFCQERLTINLERITLIINMSFKDHRVNGTLQAQGVTARSQLIIRKWKRKAQERKAKRNAFQITVRTTAHHMAMTHMTLQRLLSLLSPLLIGFI